MKRFSEEIDDCRKLNYNIIDSEAKYKIAMQCNITTRKTGQHKKSTFVTNERKRTVRKTVGIIVAITQIKSTKKLPSCIIFHYINPKFQSSMNR